MSPRIFIENPPPFKRTQRKISAAGVCVVDGAMEEGLETIRFYLKADLQLRGFHHSDIDPYESRRMRGNVPIQRFNTFDYASFLKRNLKDFTGLLIPHHIGVYQKPEDQAAEFTRLTGNGIHDVVIVGRPSHDPRPGANYHASVPQLLEYLNARHDDFGLILGAIGIHLRTEEADIIARKYQAAGHRLRLMGQFLDEADEMVEFLGRLAHTFAAKGLNMSGLEYNVGLAIFGLKNRQFYARLLRKQVLECESRFAKLKNQQQRLLESVQMNMEFAERILEAGQRHGVDIGFSIQPLIERSADGSLHPAVETAVELAKKLQRLG